MMGQMFTPSLPTFVSTADVAAMLDQTVEHFLRVRQGLEDTHGFPLPMPHWRRPMKWRRDQIRGWIEAQGRPQAQIPPRDLGPNVVLLEEARRA